MERVQPGSSWGTPGQAPSRPFPVIEERTNGIERNLNLYRMLEEHDEILKHLTTLLNRGCAAIERVAGYMDDASKEPIEDHPSTPNHFERMQSQLRAYRQSLRHLEKVVLNLESL